MCIRDSCKIDPDIKLKEQRYGIIYIRGKDEFQMQDIDSAFDYIPDEMCIRDRCNSPRPLTTKLSLVNGSTFKLTSR